DQQKATNPADQAEKVADLLEEYHGKGKNIEIENIDPDASPTKVEDLTNEVAEKYGGQVKKYKTFAETYPEKFQKLGDLAKVEQAALDPLVRGALPEEMADFFSSTYGTFRDLPGRLKDAQEEQK